MRTKDVDVKKQLQYHTRRAQRIYGEIQDCLPPERHDCCCDTDKAWQGKCVFP